MFMVTELNPFAGRTLRIPRPTACRVEDESRSQADVQVAQAQWECAERDRLEQLARPTSQYAELMAAETREEPASKALENRLRVAFLATKGHTMAMWLAQREVIVADAAGNRRSSSAP
jgi:hypothetical protein